MYVCVYVRVLYLLVKVLAEAVLQHCIEGCDGLRLELKAHNGAHLWGEWPGGRGVARVSGRVGYCAERLEGEAGGNAGR